MNIQDRVEGIKQKAADENVLLLEAYHSTVRNHMDEEFPTIRLVRNEENLYKLFTFAKSNSSPMFLYEHIVTEDDIQAAMIAEVDIEAEVEDDDPQWIKLLKEKAKAHNERVKKIERDCLIMISLYTVLPSQVVVQMLFHHEKWDEWIDLINCTAKELIEELEDESPDVYEKKEQIKRQKDEKQQQIREAILKKWEEYLLSHPDFPFQTNQSLRRTFFSTHRKEFIQSLLKNEQEEFDKLPYLDLHTQLEIVWKKFKQK
jgi:hypothetical protein